jgi:hypothetical protein
MLYSSLFADEEGQDADAEMHDASSSLFDTLRGLTAQEDGDIPADDVRRHFVESGMFSFTRPIVASVPMEESAVAEDSMSFKGFRKQRKAVRTTCGRCGVGGRTIKNHGGATRETVNHPAKYKMECQSMFGGCGHRFLLNRDPNPDGTHTQVDSNFTIPGEVKARPDYKCGECGMIKVRGHKAVCKGKRPVDAMSNAGAVLKRAKTLLGEGYGPDTADDDDDDGGAFPSLALSSSAPFSMLASVVASEKPVPVASGAPAVASGAPAVASGAAAVASGAPAVASGAPAVASGAPAVASGAAAVASAAVVAPVASVAPAVASAAAATAVATGVTAAPVAPAVATGGLTASKGEDNDAEDDGESKAQSTLLSIAKAALMNRAVQVRNGNAAMTLLKLKRYKVKGDGSCWVYAMLACAGLCESRSLTSEQTPTSRDRGMDRVCRNLAYLWLFDHQNVMLRDEIETLDEILDKLPQHPMVDDDDFGSFGTINTIMGLAAYLDVSVVCWDKTTLRNSNAQQQVIMHMHDDTSPDAEIKEATMTPSEIVTFSQLDPRVMHIEWNGVNHYAALIGPSDVPIKQSVRNALMLATPVADVNPKSLTPVGKPSIKKMGNVSGWMHLTDLYRSDLSLKVVPAVARNKPLKQLLELSRTKNYHGVIYYSGAQQSDVVCYVKFPHDAKLTAADFLKSGDFSSHLYIDKSWMEATTITMPPDPHASNCPCRTIYTRRMDVVDCIGCKKSFHAKCVGVADVSKVGEWRCLGCAK